MIGGNITAVCVSDIGLWNDGVVCTFVGVDVVVNSGIPMLTSAQFLI